MGRVERAQHYVGDLHYAEAVMTRFDENRDGRLTNPEIDKAADVFTGFFIKFAKDKMNKELSLKQARGVFYFILTYRKMPETSGWGDWYETVWLTYVSTGSLSLNRSDLSLVFRVIIAKLSERPKAVPEPVAMPCHGPDLINPESCPDFSNSP
ncbi:MAG: hypothetical protein HC883_04785 [Bdellovibrionaceae bacterium]|nr:hypothetical protein [Pseudobdellovibrionaceae bacterium]